MRIWTRSNKTAAVIINTGRCRHVLVSGVTFTFIILSTEDRIIWHHVYNASGTNDCYQKTIQVTQVMTASTGDSIALDYIVG